MFFLSSQSPLVLTCLLDGAVHAFVPAPAPTLSPSLSRYQVAGGGQAPPQSTPISLPFCTPSEQLGLEQVLVLASHTLLTQSLALRHFLVSAQAGQVAPPQSTSVSSPFWVRSVQLAFWQMLLRHTLLTQSPCLRHFWVWTHAGQVAPPQSTSVSSPLCALSVQLALVQVLAVGSHTLLRQSVPLRHFLVSAHAGQVAPPQSTSVSSPLNTWSVQLALVQVLAVGSHTLLRQSVPLRHFLVSAHAGQVAPPQSISVSSPFCLPSVHVGGGRSGIS